MKKKLFSMLMVCVLAVCLCVPAFAEERPHFYRDAQFTVPNKGDLYLNIAGKPGTIIKNRRLSIYQTTAPSTDQTFTGIDFYYYGRYGRYWAKQQTNMWYAINKDNNAYADGYNALMWPVDVWSTTAYNADSAFKRSTTQPFSLMEKSYNLAYTSAKNGGKVYFNAPGSTWTTHLK